MENKQCEWTRAIQNCKKKGFTLIELIVVMAIIGILVLLAAPRFLGQTDEAIQTKHVANAKNVEDASERYFIKEQDWPRLTDDAYTDAEIEAFADKIVDITGEEINLDPKGNYYDIDYDKLSDYVTVADADKGNYILQNPVGKVYYLEGLSEARKSVTDGAPAPVTKEIPEYYVQATDSDFTYVASASAPNGIGYNRYIGTDDYVILPDSINGEPVTDAFLMFYDTTVKGVAGNIPLLTDTKLMFYKSLAANLDLSNFNTSNVVNMQGMFRDAQASSIDLSVFDTASVTNMHQMFFMSQANTLNLTSLNTSNVTNMEQMFAYSNATSIDVSSFDTGNVTNMRLMFYQTKATTLDLSNFNTLNVTDMGGLFREAQATYIDVSSFDTSKVVSMPLMFYKTKAATLDLRSFDTAKVTDVRDMFRFSTSTIGYARTTTDAYKLNNSSYKPSTLTFIVK